MTKPGMRIAAAVATTRLRGSSRAVLGIAVPVAVSISLAMFTLAGARRTESSYSTFLGDVRASTMSVSTSLGYDAAVNARIAALPNVARSRTSVGFNAYVLSGGVADLSQGFEATGTFDGRFFDQDLFTATSGRTADADRLDEVNVNEYAAQRYGYRVGQQFDIGIFGDDLGAPPTMVQHVTVVGIGLLTDEVIQDEADRTGRLLLTPALSQRATGLQSYSLQGLELRHGAADVAGVLAALDGILPPGTTDFQYTADLRRHAQSALRPSSITLGAFGLIAGIVGLVLTAQAIARLHRREESERSILHALGASPATTRLAWLTAPVLGIVSGTVVAAFVAALASPLMPIGPVRGLRSVGGFDVDGLVLGVGGIVVLVVLVADAVAVSIVRSSERSVRRRRPMRRPSRVIGAMTSVGMPLTPTTGARFAIDSDASGGGASMRSVMSGLALAISALVVSMTFVSSMHELTTTPRLFGWNWDVAVVGGNGYANIDTARATAIFAHDPNIADWSGAFFGQDAIDGHPTDLLGMQPDSTVHPPLTDGRWIRDDSEIVLGAETASALGAHIGVPVVLAGETSPHTVTVVGIATLPTIGRTHATHVSLGTGAVVVPSLVPGAGLDLFQQPTAGLGPHVFLLRLRPGTDVDAALTALRSEIQPLATIAGIDALPVQRPAEIINSTSVGAMPLLLASALSIAAAVSLGLALAASVRRRRHDLGVLRALGATSRQLARIVTAEAVTTAVVGLAVGIPLGTVFGRILWRAFAGALHVVAEPVVPPIALGGVVLVTIVVAAIAALPPSRASRRLLVADVVREGG